MTRLEPRGRDPAHKPKHVAKLGKAVELIGPPGAGKTMVKRALNRTGRFVTPSRMAAAVPPRPVQPSACVADEVRTLSSVFTRIITSSRAPSKRARHMAEVFARLEEIAEISGSEAHYVLDEYLLQKMIGHISVSVRPWRFTREVWRILRSPLVPNWVVIVDCSLEERMQRQVGRGRVVSSVKKAPRYRMSLTLVSILLRLSGRKVLRVDSGTRSPGEIAKQIVSWMGEDDQPRASGESAGKRAPNQA